MKHVALTFDDGPNPPYTHQILDILKKNKVKATFFVCGANIQRHPEIVRKIAKAGHLVGNHSYYHDRLSTFSGTNYQEIIQTQKLIDELIHQKEKLYRPPYGVIPPWLKRKLTGKNFKIILFDAIGKDWEKEITVEKIIKNIVSKTKDGSIILLHDGHGIRENADRSKTVGALPEIIYRVKKEEYNFVFPTDLPTQ